MKFLIVIVLFSLNSAFALSIPKAPKRGKFPWIQFLGNYRYINCKIKNSDPIWAEFPEKTSIEISSYSSEDPHYLNMIRWTDDNNGILLGLAISKINQGKQIEIDPDTKKVIHTVNSYSTKDGVYGFLSWNVQDINVGWSSIQLIQNSAGEFSYIMRIQRTDDPYMKEEICSLKRE